MIVLAWYNLRGAQKTNEQRWIELSEAFTEVTTANQERHHEIVVENTRSNGEIKTAIEKFHMLIDERIPRKWSR